MSTATVQVQTRSTSADADPAPVLSLTTDHVAGIRSLRRSVIETLGSCGCTELLIDTAALLATELLSNGLQYADTGGETCTVRLDVYWNGHDLTISVTDPDPRVPAARTAAVADDDEHGRGLVLVEALTTCWGTVPRSNGKTVWCHLT
ncbi:ATP-binding protein [Streptomyces sp. NBC_01244]|uniref:ATP-binding protein n=1 Tax=Streptomyces sp. NBC_01244 TaxID=2903797 RepID=UPI002E0EB66A|nr:ATP-binding protein [Streptomyces sp. NBC_01244]